MPPIGYAIDLPRWLWVGEAAGVESRVRFELLGPLRAFTDGTEELIGSGRTRVVLALLLLHPSRTVSVEQLAEAVWSSAAPGTARNQIQTCVSQLRRRFGSALEIVTEPAGYRMAVDPQQVDAHRFRAIVADARAATKAGQPGEARERYRAALELWRGPALAGVDGELARRLADSLEAEREQAIEECMETELALGGGRELVAELTELVRRFPYRERLHAALMHALYRAERVGEALAAFRASRRQFRDELGTEPGDTLQSLHQAILNRDPDLSPRPAGPLPAALVPAELPRDLPVETSYFVGRAEEIDQVRSALVPPVGQERRRPPVVVLYGPGGIGKSVLAVRVAHELAREFPDGQLYIDLCGSTPQMRPLEPIEALSRFLRRLAVEPADIPHNEDEAAARFRSLTADRRLLIVLDNAAGKDQLVPLLPAAPSCGVVVTGRNALPTLDANRRVRLGPLPDADGRELLAGLTGRPVSAEPDAAGQVVTRCDGLPLAIRIAAGRLAARPDLTLGEYAQRLADSSRRLDELQLDDLAVRASIRISYDALLTGDDAQRLAALTFRTLGLLHVPNLAPPVLAAVLLEPDIATVRAILDRLVDAQLVEPVPSGRYRLHDLVRLVAMERAVDEDPTIERDQAVHRAIAYYTGALWSAHRRLRPTRTSLFGNPPVPAASMPTFPEPTLASKWIDEELCTLEAALHQAVSATGDGSRLALWLGDTLWENLDIRCDWHAARRVGRLVMDAGGKRDDQELFVQGLVLHARSDANLGAYDAALCQLKLALDKLRELDNRIGVAVVLNGLGVIHTRRHEPEEALRCYEEALDLATGQELTNLAANVLNNLTVTHTSLGQLDQAVAVGQRSAAFAASENDLTTHTMALGNLSAAFCELGDYLQAVRLADQAIALSMETGASGIACQQLIIRSEVNLRRGRPDDAWEDVEQLHSLASTHGYRYGLAVAHQQRSKICAATDRLAEAARDARQAAKALTELNGEFREPLIELLVGPLDTDQTTGSEPGAAGHR